jgi:hypothetical protein
MAPRRILVQDLPRLEIIIKRCYLGPDKKIYFWQGTATNSRVSNEQVWTGTFLWCSFLFFIWGNNEFLKLMGMGVQGIFEQTLLRNYN